MQQILLFILLGLGAGALIAGLALGVVLTYRGSGIINLATGGIAMLAGYAYWALRTGRIANLPVCYCETHDAKPPIRCHFSPKSETFMVTNVGCRTVRSSAGMASSRIVVPGRS